MKIIKTLHVTRETKQSENVGIFVWNSKSKTTLNARCVSDSYFFLPNSHDRIAATKSWNRSFFKMIKIKR